MEFPDPVVSANLYCKGRLDELIQRVIFPFWRELKARDPGRNCYLWMLRYNRRGEHLKIRLHGPESCRTHGQRLLGEAADTYFSSLEAPVEFEPAPSWEPPPIDKEDQASSRAADRRLLWTTYERSPICLGSRPLLDDDRYVACLTHALGCGYELIFEAFRSESPGSLLWKLRHTTLLKMLISGLAATQIPTSQRLDYLAYHREWLVRVTVFRNCWDPERAEEILSSFDRRTERMAASIPVIEKVVCAEWDRESGESDVSHSAWRKALHDLSNLIVPRRGRPEWELDPFASDPVFLPLFKVFHGVANQLGLPRLDEAFAHHLLLYAAGGGVRSASRVRFLPD